MPTDTSISPPAVVAAVSRKRHTFVRPYVPSAAARSELAWRRLRHLYWMGFAALVAVVTAKTNVRTFEASMGALLIICAAMLPMYLWIYGKVRGLPLYPAYALTCIWTFALPLVTENPVVAQFPGWNHLVAGASVAGFLLIGTVAWRAVARRPPRPPVLCWAMNEAQTVPALMAALGLCALWTMSTNASWLRLPPGIDSLARAILLAVQSLSCFVLSYRLGSGKLSPPMVMVFFVLLGALMVTILPSLLLIYAMSMAAVTMLAYVVAAKRLPWIVGLGVLCIFGFLHLGKSKMRDKYWDVDDDRRPVSPFHYPAFYADWVNASLDAVREGSDSDDPSASLLERASLMHLLLYFQAATPAAIPYLNGETYAVIPHMFIPRLFDPEKPRSNEASFILAIHYGMQTREDTDVTTFAFGLINEAYANFGFIGMGGLAVVLGAFYGKVAQWARQMPILSLRALFAVLIASFSFQSEYSSTFYVAALFQSSVVLVAVAILFMRRNRRLDANVSLLE